MQEQIRVGIVGANAKKSWASLSHVSAIKGLTGLKLPAVATRNEQSAREASEAFGADRWFSDSLAMIDDDQIDVITISGRRGRLTSYRDRIAGTFESSCAAGGPIVFF